MESSQEDLQKHGMRRRLGKEQLYLQSFTLSMSLRAHDEISKRDLEVETLFRCDAAAH